MLLLPSSFTVTFHNGKHQVMIPIVMNKLEQQGFFKKYPRATAPLQVNSSCKTLAEDKGSGIIAQDYIKLLNVRLGFSVLC